MLVYFVLFFKGGSTERIKGEEQTWVDLLDCRACLERAFLWDSDSSSRTGVRYDLQKRRKHKRGGYYFGHQTSISWIFFKKFKLKCRVMIFNKWESMEDFCSFTCFTFQILLILHTSTHRLYSCFKMLKDLFTIWDVFSFLPSSTVFEKSLFKQHKVFSQSEAAAADKKEIWPDLQIKI